MCPCPERKHIYCRCPFNISNFMENSKRYKRKIICAFSYTVTSTVSPEKISSPTFMIMKIIPASLKYGGKT
jgi:hypothetical protein